jgi:putative ABC transport system permease protein
MLQDLKYGFRQLVRQPGFTAVALPTLAVGLGASIATFSVFDGALLRPAPFPQSDRLVVPYITAAAPERPSGRQRWSWGRFALLAQWNTVLERVGAYSRTNVNLTDGEEPERVAAEIASSGYFAALRVEALRGRTFSAEEDSSGAPVALVSWSLWQRRWAGETPFVGRSIRVSGTLITALE